MVSRLRRLLSFNSDSSNKDIINSNEHRISFIFRAPSPDNYDSWTVPEIEVDITYKIETFDFVRAYSVKTHEEVINYKMVYKQLLSLSITQLKVIWKQITDIRILVLSKYY